MKRPVLLLLSPLDAPTHPYAAIPQLTSWLRSKGREATAVDVNLEFHRWLVRPERLERLIPSGRRAMEELGRQSSPDPVDRERLRTLERAFATVDALGAVFRPALDPADAAGAGSRIEALSAVLGIAFLPGRHERVQQTPLGCQYAGRADPYSSRSIVEALESQGSLFDEFYEELLPPLLERDWLVAGISIPFPSQCEPGLRMARAIKRIRPGLSVVAGGSYVGMHLGRTREAALFRYVDVMVSGPGEEPLARLCGELERSRPDFSTVGGATFLAEGRVVRTDPCRAPSLDETPVPGDSLDRARYFGGADDSFLRMKLSQGCGWGRCTFCNLEGSGLFPLDRPDEERTFEKVRTLVGRGARSISFADDEADSAMLLRFARRVVEAGLELRWTVNARLHPRMTMAWATALREAGCHTLAVGIEHLDDGLLLGMRKGIDRALIDRSLENLAWGGLPVLAYLMVGLPGETEELARTTFRAVLERVRDGSLANVVYSPFGLTPGSPVHDDPAAHGISALRPPPGADLNPPLFDFDSAGMNRHRALELADEFNGAVREERSRRRGTAPELPSAPRPERSPLEEVARP